PTPSVQRTLGRAEQRLIQVGRRLRHVLAALADIAGTLFLGQVLDFPGNDRLQGQLLLLLSQLAAVRPLAQLDRLFQALIHLGRDVAQHVDEVVHGNSGDWFAMRGIVPSPHAGQTVESPGRPMAAYRPEVGAPTKNSQTEPNGFVGAPPRPPTAIAPSLP